MNKIGTRWTLVLSAFLPLLSHSALAQQQIGSGVYVCDGAAQAGPCQPESDADAGYSSTPVVRWADRWGAIADDGDGVFGIVSNMSSERAAQRLAMDQCKSRGGKRCEVQLAYHNQCAAVAASTSMSFSSGSETVEEAKDRAMDRCKGSGNQCWIYYSGCSLPERVQ